MPTTFANLEARAARAAVRRTANATGEWRPVVGAAVPGIRLVFDRESSDGVEGMVADRRAMVQAVESDLIGVARNDQIVIARDAVGASTPPPVTYAVSRASPDGAGLVVIELVGAGTL